MRLEFVEDINSPTGWMVQGELNAANITRTNIIGCNSVVHVIDEVLLPDEDILPIGTTTIGEAIDTAESFEMLLTPLQPGEEERREEARSRLMLTEVSIGTDEFFGSPEAEDDLVASILTDAEDAFTQADGSERSF